MAEIGSSILSRSCLKQRGLYEAALRREVQALSRTATPPKPPEPDSPTFKTQGLNYTAFITLVTNMTEYQGVFVNSDGEVKVSRMIRGRGESGGARGFDR